MSELADFRLSAGARATLAALAPIVLTDEVDALGVREDVVDRVELFLRSVPTPVRLALAAGLMGFEQSARLDPRSLGRGFSSLPRLRAEAFFHAAWESNLEPVRQLARGLKMILTVSYYEHPAKKRQLGYDPERWIARVAAERLERYAEEIRKGEAVVLAPAPLLDELRDAGVAPGTRVRA
ncbi:MAG: hypothetical protein AB7N76_04435 [Planctomycetota bacterium]